MFKKAWEMAKYGQPDIKVEYFMDFKAQEERQIIEIIKKIRNT